MSVVGWCACHGITKANYYYWLRRVREACLETMEAEIPGQRVTPVPPGLLPQEPESGRAQAGLDISTKGFSVHVTESTPIHLLSAVLKVIRNAE